MTKRIRGGAFGVLAFYAGLMLLGIFGAESASAQAASSELAVGVRSVHFLPNGSTQVVVSVTGSAVRTSLTRDNFTLTENGSAVGGMTAERVYGPNGIPVAVALLFDVSGSSRGAQLALAKSVAKQFMTELPESTKIAVVSFGRTPSVLIDFTSDRGQSTLAIDTLQARGYGAIWDSVIAAARLVQRQPGVQGNIVLFSDGYDSASQASLAEAVQAVQESNTPVNSVSLDSVNVDNQALTTLARAVPGGGFSTARDLTDLNAKLSSVAHSIASQYVLTYPSDDLNSENVAVTVTATTGGRTASGSLTVPNTRQPVAAPAGGGGALVGMLASRLGLYLGAGVVFLILMLFFAYPLTRPPTKEVEKMLARSLEAYETTDTTGRRKRRKREKVDQVPGVGGFLNRSSLGARAIEIAARVPRPKDYDERMQKLLDKAGWPLRSTEFIVLQIGAILGGALIGFVLLLNPVIGIMLVGIGAMIPRMILSQKISKREAAFLEQLPETLQLLAGSLQAGYGFLQALDTVSKESPEPTGHEFSRVLAEARLGMPIEDALDNMAERVGGDDFKWVVLAVNIQRQVGGNLAALLHTVATTLREREMVRRQIKTLSAEGRLSAIILVALPFVLFGYLSLINPDYLSQLTGETIGRIAIMIALVLIGLGIVWMRKIIKIDV